MAQLLSALVLPFDTGLAVQLCPQQQLRRLQGHGLSLASKSVRFKVYAATVHAACAGGQPIRNETTTPVADDSVPVAVK